MYDEQRHLGSLANQLQDVRDQLRQSQLLLARAQDKRRHYKKSWQQAQKDALRRRNLLHKAATQVDKMRRFITDQSHKHYEARTVLLINRQWDNFPDGPDRVEQEIWLGKRRFNMNGGAMGTKIKWIRCEWVDYFKWAQIPETRGTKDGGGSIKLWVTFIHLYDDRQHQKHTIDDWRNVGNIFAFNYLFNGFSVADTT